MSQTVSDDSASSLSFCTLASTSIDELLLCFNESFKNYFVPLQLTREQLLKKIKTERILLALSVGIFQQGRLTGFILHGADQSRGQLTAYNAGTGILPEHRGAGLTRPLYKYALDLLRTNKIHHSVLEVIQQNIPALRAYENAGFRIKRQLDSFRQGDAKWDGTHLKCLKRRLGIDFADINISCSWEPAWQYSWNSLNRAAPDYQLFLAGSSSAPVAYCIANPATGRIAHFGCKNFSQNQRAMKDLFCYVADHALKELSVMHVDHEACHAINFLKSLGFTSFLNSHEMELLF